ncbi:hypothetical protein HPB48_014588 [Haemaphysalis longicornis]|uniref:Uncharacterized protein n=1 Tax=Haemaphysalis longicornis TaxID=44386 RepID=A0A9J6FE75_HAELO|nr:hypothetical protein HPB48_014588 [Haemaphysalis longicornis]
MIALHWMKGDMNRWKQFQRYWIREIHTQSTITIRSFAWKGEPGGHGDRRNNISAGTFVGRMAAWMAVVENK